MGYTYSTHEAAAKECARLNAKRQPKVEYAPRKYYLGDNFVFRWGVGKWRHELVRETEHHKFFDGFVWRR